jgi:hypothetical protein
MEPRNRFQGMNSTNLCSLAGRYDNPFPPRCLAPIDSLKIPTQIGSRYCPVRLKIPKDMLANRASDAWRFKHMEILTLKLYVCASLNGTQDYITVLLNMLNDFPPILPPS